MVPLTTTRTVGRGGLDVDVHRVQAGRPGDLGGQIPSRAGRPGAAAGHVDRRRGRSQSATWRPWIQMPAWMTPRVTSSSSGQISAIWTDSVTPRSSMREPARLGPPGGTRTTHLGRRPCT